MRSVVKAVVIVLALPLSGQAQQAPAGPQSSNPAARLLASRADLGLTAEQVRRLEEIDRRATQQDSELRASLEALRGRPAGAPLRMRDMTPEQRQQLLSARGEMEPLAAQLRALHVQVAADSRAVLTVEQSDRARLAVFAGPGQGAGRGPAAGAGRGRGPGAAVGQGRVRRPGAAAGAGGGRGPGGAAGLRPGAGWGPGAGTGLRAGRGFAPQPGR